MPRRAVQLVHVDVVDVQPSQAGFDPTSQVELAFTGFLSNVTDNGQLLTGFDAVGPGEIQGESLAPEPMGLALLGMAGLFAAGRRRR